MSSPEVVYGPPPAFPVTVPVAVIGGGACGLSAALAAVDAGAQALVIERDATPAGSTALSSGFIPASGTRWQLAAGVQDDAARMTNDILAKSNHLADADCVRQMSIESGPTLEWLADAHGLEFNLVTGFTYPGHSVERMHAHVGRTGKSLMGALLDAAAKAGVDILSHATARVLFVDSAGHVRGLGVERSDGSVEHIGCRTLVLACNGYGANPVLVQELIPEMADALYFGHPGNQGEAVIWGRALGAALADLGAYQGHGSVATPHGALITWAVMMEGGIQVNNTGARFSNEHHGYSEQAVAVLAQPDGVAWNIYDLRLHELAWEFEDYRDACELGAVHRAADAASLAGRIGVPADELQATLSGCAAFQTGRRSDPFGRDFTGQCALEPPYFAVKVTGALFHTQGGLCVDRTAAVLGTDGEPFTNLFAGGGAARGLSGPAVWGYLSGNGLLSAVVLGRLAGTSAARVSGTSVEISQ